MALRPRTSRYTAEDFLAVGASQKEYEDYLNSLKVSRPIGRSTGQMNPAFSNAILASANSKYNNPSNNSVVDTNQQSQVVQPVAQTVQPSMPLRVGPVVPEQQQTTAQSPQEVYRQSLIRIRNGSTPSQQAMDAARSMGITNTLNQTPEDPRLALAQTQQLDRGRAQFGEGLTTQKRERQDLTAREEYAKAIAALTATDKEKLALKSAETIAAGQNAVKMEESKNALQGTKYETAGEIAKQRLAGETSRDVAGITGRYGLEEESVKAKSAENIANINAKVSANASESEMQKTLIDANITSSRASAKEAAKMLSADVKSMKSVISQYSDDASAEVLSSLFENNPNEFIAFREALTERMVNSGSKLSKKDIEKITSDLVQESLSLLRE